MQISAFYVQEYASRFARNSGWQTTREFSKAHKAGERIARDTLARDGFAALVSLVNTLPERN